MHSGWNGGESLVNAASVAQVPRAQDVTKFISPTVH